MKLMFPFCSALLILVGLASCNTETEPEQTPCAPMYNTKTTLPKSDTLDIDQDGKSDFAFYIESMSGAKYGAPNEGYYYLILDTRTSSTGDHELVVQELPNNAYQLWFPFQQTLFTDSIDTTSTQKLKKSFRLISSTNIMNQIACKNWFKPSWDLVLNGNDIVKGNGEVYLVTYHRPTGKLGWMKFYLNLEAGTLEFIKYKYHNTSQVIVGE